MILAVANQKGGVGKTTSVINLSACLAASGKRCLVVDLDPQCNATSGLGITPVEEPTLLELILGESNLFQLQSVANLDTLKVMTGSPDLVGAENLLAALPERVHAVRAMLDRLKKDSVGQFDYIFLDCPPSLNLLTMNALSAADYLLIPVQAEYFALEGLTAILDTFKLASEQTNPNLKLLGLFLTMVDSRTNLANEVEAEIRRHYGESVFQTTVPRNVRLSEAPSHGLPIILYDYYSRGAKAYLDLVKEILVRCEQNDPLEGPLQYGS
jgi:chromosome partitioning protein